MMPGTTCRLSKFSATNCRGWCRVPARLPKWWTTYFAQTSNCHCDRLHRMTRCPMPNREPSPSRPCWNRYAWLHIPRLSPILTGAAQFCMHGTEGVYDGVHLHPDLHRRPQNKSEKSKCTSTTSRTLTRTAALTCTWTLRPMTRPDCSTRRASDAMQCSQRRHVCARVNDRSWAYLLSPCAY